MPNGSGEGEQNGAIALSRDPETNQVSFLYYDAITGEKIEAAVRDDIDFIGSYDNPKVYYIGLAVTAHDAGRISIGSFSNVVLLIGDITGVDN